MYETIGVEWVCCQGAGRGQIELPTGVSHTLDSICTLVKERHAAACNYRGGARVLIDLERRGGMCVASNGAVTFGFTEPGALPPILVVIHLQVGSL